MLTNIFIILAHESLTIGLLPFCSGVALRMFRVFTNIMNGMSEKPNIFKIINCHLTGWAALCSLLSGRQQGSVKPTARRKVTVSREGVGGNTFGVIENTLGVFKISFGVLRFSAGLEKFCRNTLKKRRIR